MEKKTTGATTIFRAFRYIVLTGDSRLALRAALNEAGAAADRISPTTIAASIAPRVCQRKACFDLMSVTRT